MVNKLISILFLGYIGMTSAVLFCVAFFIWITTRWFDKRLVLLHQFTCFWASLYTWSMPAWSVHIHNKEKIDNKKTYIVVSNHQSQLDILVSFRLFFHFKWVSKIEIFKLPFIGWNMYLNRYIKLKRGDADSIRQMMTDCRIALENNNSVFFFPEGTRSRTGSLRPFKPGAFLLAHELQLPVLPIAISGTYKALPKYSLNFHGKHQIDLTILDEIPYDAFRHLTAEQTAAMVRNIIGSHVNQHRIN